MMAACFHRCPDICWQVEEYQCIKAGTIAFDFIRHATDTLTGESLNAAGSEIVRFSDKGLIRSVEVYRPE